MKRLTSLLLFIFSIFNVLGQENDDMSFSDIYETLMEQRPQTGNSLIRYKAITTIDQIILGGYPPLDPGTTEFMRSLVTKAMQDIRNEIVNEGATVWQIYNHGFVVKTSSVCFGIDLYNYNHHSYFKSTELAPLLDAVFVTHEHHDHFSPVLITEMNRLGKPVVGPAEVNIIGLSEIMHAGEQKNIASLIVKAHFGLHSVPALQYEITTPEGIKILHTGDNQTSETIPEIPDVNILLLNAWVNESGNTSHIYGARKAIEKVKPDVCLPGHILELGHLGGGYIVPYSDVFKVPETGLSSDFCVLAWGERYHFPKEGNDIIRPNKIQNPRYTVEGDMLRIEWDSPAPARDRTTASYYRLSMKNYGIYYTEDTSFNFSIDSTGVYTCKIYSYDHCGNQSEEFVAMDIVIDSFSSAPRIERCYPANTDTIDVFRGVERAFRIHATDLNHDSLSYSWTLDNETLPDGNRSEFILNKEDIDPGIHHLSAHVSDQSLTTENRWLLRNYIDSAIVDDLDTLMFYVEGKWLEGFDKTSHRKRFQYTPGSETPYWAGYIFNAEFEGAYDFYVNVPKFYNLTSSAEYIFIVDSQAQDTLYLNQKEKAGGWVKLGRVNLPSEARVEVRVSRASNVTYERVAADALSFKYLDSTVDSREIDENSIKDHIFLRHYPNPFERKMLFEFSLPERIEVNLHIYNLLGKEIKTFVSGELPAGLYEYEWNSEYTPSGIYYYFFKAGNHLQSGKIILSR